MLMLLGALLMAPLPDTTRQAVVVIVRHAEKASETDRDPSLSAVGRTRAAALDSALADAHVVAILVTQFRRTSETAALVAARHHIVPTVIPTDGGVAVHAAAVARAARGPDGVVLVVGHSNTVMPIAAALGAPRRHDLCDRSYSVMLVVTPGDPHGGVLQSHFGAADPPGADACAATAPP